MFVVATGAVHARLRRRWRTWLPVLEADISRLMMKREIFWELQEIAKENPGILKNGAFFEWMCSGYIIATGVELRALVDADKHVHSLFRLLYEILEHPGVISRRAYAALYRGTPTARAFDLANHGFDLDAGSGRAVLGQRAVRSDLRALENASERIRRFVNKRIAHRTRQGSLRRLPLFKEVDGAMDVIDQIFCKYNRLLTATGMDSTHATRQDNWMAVLYEPWIKPGSTFRPV